MDAELRFLSRCWAGVLRCLLGVVLALHAGWGQAAASAETGHARASLLVHAPAGIKPGAEVWLGLRIEHQPHWHTYWLNPGDSGLPTTTAWTLPAGFAAGDIAWPTPKQLPLGPLMNYGYDGDLLLPVRLTVPPDYQGGPVPVKLRADFLICEEVCIPEFAELDTVLAPGAAAAHGALFQNAFGQAPVEVPGLRAAARIEDQALVIEASGLPPAYRGQPLQFFPANGSVIDHPAPLAQEWKGGQLVLRAPLSSQRSDSPVSMDAVITAGHRAPGIRVAFDIAGPWPQPGAAGAAATPAPAAAAVAAATAVTSSAPDGGAERPWLMVLGFAFLGGAILNLMPCVFPVLSLKVLGFAQHGGERRRIVAGGFAYSLGVIASFLLLAGLLLALRASGEQLGWGFQLQSPAFVAALAVLFTLIGFNLAGLFEFSHMLPGSILNARARNPVLDDFLTGVLAVAVASPCTAPFMGAALGAALAQPAPQALSVFAALGAGMAAPYLAASLFPGLARRLPRPGPWMVRFKTFMAFPMFATVVWLLWVLGQQAGADAVAAVLALIVAGAFGAWVLRIPARSRAGRGAGIGAAVLTFLAVSAWAWPAFRYAQEAPGAGAGAVEASGGWQAWSPQALDQAREQGRPVFVDFTAAWCVTCQYNKRTTLADPELMEDFRARGVVLLRADWTRRDETITRALKELGRSGVPVYAVYRKGERQPTLLSEMLSVDEVRQALAAPGQG